MFPSPRQLLLICLVWAVIAWYTVAVWAMKAGDSGLGDAFGHFYAIRAPLVGAVLGLVWSPVFALGYHPRRLRSAHEEGRDLYSEESSFRHWFRFIRGAFLGQLVGGSISLVLLVLWPAEMWNSRWQAIPWAGLMWKSYWFLFVPAAGAAGALSVWMALRHRERPPVRR